MKKVILFAGILSLIYACQPNVNNDAAQVAIMKQNVIDSINTERALAQQQKTIDSLRIVAQRTPKTKTKTVVVERISDDEQTSDAPKVGSVSKSKKRLNNTQKGALIGLGVGAVTGVATSKDKVQGGIIGGIIGGAAGAGAGAIIDKKKKQKQNQN